MPIFRDCESFRKSNEMQFEVLDFYLFYKFEHLQVVAVLIWLFLEAEVPNNHLYWSTKCLKLDTQSPLKCWRICAPRAETSRYKKGGCWWASSVLDPKFCNECRFPCTLLCSMTERGADSTTGLGFTAHKHAQDRTSPDAPWWPAYIMSLA